MPGGNGVSGPVLADTASRWSDLTLRILSALVLLPVAIFCVWAGGIWFLLLTAAVSAGLAIEWVLLCGYSVTVWPGIALPAVMILAPVCATFGAPWAGLLLVALGAAAVALKPGAHGKASLAFGFPYIGLAAISVAWLRADGGAGWPNTLFILVIIWASDIGAYAAGRLAGGPKMAPSISPGKTWSGAMGGLISAVLGGLAVATCLSSGFSSFRVAVVAFVLGVISQMGDLLESALKRHFGVKDSGTIIPGHGGLLDRLDALLAVAPAAALLAFSVGRGVVLWR